MRKEVREGIVENMSGYKSGRMEKWLGLGRER